MPCIAEEDKLHIHLQNEMDEDMHSVLRANYHLEDINELRHRIELVEEQADKCVVGVNSDIITAYEASSCLFEVSK